MDSRDDSQNATPSNSSTSKVKTLKAIAAASLKTRFYETYCRRQPFSFPDFVIYYITKNPPSRKIYKKMIKSCKYIFVTNKIIVIRKLWYRYLKGKWTTLVERNFFELNIIECKFWITDSVGIHNNTAETGLQNLLSSIVPRIYRCIAKYLSVGYQAISYQDYCLLSSCAEGIDFYNITVKNEDGSITPFEKLIEAAPKLENATFSSNTILSSITSNTVQELVKLLNFSKLKYLTLDEIPETFNLEAFYIYMKTNKITSFSFRFVDTVSEAYKIRLNAIVDEIIATENRGYKLPFINFVDLGAEKRNKLYKIYNNSGKK